MNPDPTIFDPYKFEPGPVLISHKVKADIDNGLLVDPLIFRHLRGDYGAVPSIVKERNDKVIEQNWGGAAQDIHSHYDTTHFGPIKVVTEQHEPLFGHTRTTFVMHPEEHPDAQP